MQCCDVLVAGGGSAGLAAAIAAGRLGAQTLLVERAGSLGGMTSAALVHSICGLYRLPENEEEYDAASARERPPNTAHVFANPGFAAEFAARLLLSGGATGPHRMGRVDILLQHPTAFARLADEMAREVSNLEVRFHTEIIAVDSDFRSVEICCRGERTRIVAGAIVDATGDAVVASLGGAECEQESGARLQRPAFIFALHGVDPRAVDDDRRLKIAGRIAAATQSGVLPQGALGAALRASGRGSETFVTIDLNAPNYDPLDSRCLSELEMQGRELATRLAEFLRREVPGFAQSFISAFPARVGVRESRRVIGQHRLETHDIELGAEFPEAVALATWPIELRETARGPRLRFPKDNRPCQIPLGSLRARDCQNLFVAGRCISCSHDAQASIRVIGTCLATGEAAGLAAALQVLHGACDAAGVRAARDRLLKDAARAAPS